jgi:hypothetical protein
MADFWDRWSPLEPGGVEDRRQDPPPPLDPARALDPMPIAKRIGGSIYPGTGGWPAMPIPPGPPSELARKLGADDLDRAIAFQMLLHHAGLGKK